MDIQLIACCEVDPFLCAELRICEINVIASADAGRPARGYRAVGNIDIVSCRNRCVISRADGAARDIDIVSSADISCSTGIDIAACDIDIVAGGEGCIPLRVDVAVCDVQILARCDVGVAA